MTGMLPPLPPALRMKLESPGTQRVRLKSEGSYRTLHSLKKGFISRKTGGAGIEGEEGAKKPNNDQRKRESEK